MNLLKNPAYLERFFSKDKQGYDQIVPAFYFGFWFADGYRAEYRERAYRVVSDYWSLCGEHLRWMLHPKTHYWQEITDDYDLSDWRALFPEEDWVWTMTFHSGRIKHEAAQYQVLGIGNGTRTYGYSSLYLFVPAHWFAEHLDQHPITLYLRWAQMLQAHHGTAGLGLVPPEDEPRKAAVGPIARALANQCPGFELCEPLSQFGLAFDGTLAPNWLNLLDDDLLNQLGGQVALRRTLNEASPVDEVQIHPFEGGVILSAGEHPQLYQDDQPGTNPLSYRTVAHALRPVRSKRPWGFWGVDQTDSLDWLARFD